MNAEEPHKLEEVIINSELWHRPAGLPDPDVVNKALIALARTLADAPAGSSATLLSFLNDLCEEKTALRIYMLAWDFSMLYSIDREWFQSWYFNWTTNERLTFRFDCCLQSYHVGPVATKLAELFESRWKCVRGDEVDLPPPSEVKVDLDPTLKIAASQVAISRTQRHGSDTPCVQEIRRLFLDAIHTADNVIYIENQYFSSKALYNALLTRMRETSRSRIEIVLVIAKDAEALLEQLSIGFVQAKLIHHLKEVAAATGHSFGMYYPASVGSDGEDVATYIHSNSC